MSAGDYGDAFPNSTKVYVEGHAGDIVVAAPMREVALSGDAPPLRVYDTSGPRGIDVRLGLPLTRRDWVVGRQDVEEGPRPQLPGQQSRKERDRREQSVRAPGRGHWRQYGVACRPVAPLDHGAEPQLQRFRRHRRRIQQ